MAFSSKILGQGSIVGCAKRMVWGTWASGSTTGGDIKTGLNSVENISLDAKGSAVTTNGVVYNETLPVSGGVVTIVTDSGVDGAWKAIGD